MAFDESVVGTRRRAAVRAATVLGLVAGCVALALAPAGMQSGRAASGFAAPGLMLDASVGPERELVLPTIDRGAPSSKVTPAARNRSIKTSCVWFE